MYVVELSHDAVLQLKEIGHYIARDNYLRSVTFIDEFIAHITKLGDFPHIYRKIGRFRRLIFGN